MSVLSHPLLLQSSGGGSFITRYTYFHDLKINCNILKSYKIKHVLFGSGGSNSIILIVNPLTEDKNNTFVFKILPKNIYRNLKVKPNYNEIEIRIHQFLTKKFKLNNRTPHIVGLYQYGQCPNLRSIIKDISSTKSKLSTTKCPTFESYEKDFLKKPIEMSIPQRNLCNLLLEIEMKQVETTFDYAILEYCHGDISFIIESFANGLKTFSRGKENQQRLNEYISSFRRFLLTIIFQIVFTLAVIKDSYPGFLHGDLFLRNILYVNVHAHTDTAYMAYYYKDKVFYLPSNGIYAKIADFGHSIISNNKSSVEKFEPNTFDSNNPVNKFNYYNPFDTKSDIFNFLHDLYDGENLGTTSLKTLFEEQNNGFPVEIKKLINKFIDIKVIDKINKVNPEQLHLAWNIYGVKLLEDTVKTPSEYLSGDYFKELEIIPKDMGYIETHFNKP